MIRISLLLCLALPLFGQTFLADLSPVTKKSDGEVDYLFTSLIISHTVIQLVDMHLTKKAVRLGAKEANPLFRSLLENGQTEAFVATKTVAILATNFFCKKIYKNDETKAYVTLVLLNVAYLIIVRNNYEVAIQVGI